jgi:hypothetical protein
MLRLSCVILSIMFCLSLHAEMTTPIEILQIDPAVQGVMLLLSMSNDRGKTITPMNSEPFCRITGIRVVTHDGTVLAVSSVQQTVENGIIYNIVHFTDRDVFWIISKKTPPYILIQVFSYGKEQEVMRALVIQQ